MDETREMQKLHGFLRCTIYGMVALEAAIFIYRDLPMWGIFHPVIYKLSTIAVYKTLLNSKLATLILICLVSIGTLARKKTNLDPKKHIIYPLSAGLLLFFGSIFLFGRPSGYAFANTTWFNFGYMFCSFLGTLTISLSLDNVSKMIRSGLGKDKWNTEGESFMQSLQKLTGDGVINIPMQFYYKAKVWNGWLNLPNLARSCLIVGVPGSGKTFGLFNPILKQLIAFEQSLAVYDLKHPNLGKLVYFHYLLARQNGKYKKHKFHVLNLVEPEKSRRINPFRPDYLRTLADASETAEALVEAMKKGDRSGGSDQFFTQSSINFLAACIYFFSKFQKGRYSTLPHVLAFLNCSYAEIFRALFSEPELVSLLAPFKSAYQLKAFDQLEGQIGTLRVYIGRLATKETFWVFSGDDFNLKLSDPKDPGVLVLANDPSTQNINSACYAVVLNRMTRLMNSMGNLPSALVVDEASSVYLHRIESTIQSAREMKFSVILGLQEIPILKQQYGKDAAAVITSIVGNVLSGAVRNKETLEWLERLFGKVKQMNESLSIDRNKTSTSLSEKLEPLIPAGKIASLKAGEIVGLVAAETRPQYTGTYETTAVNCRINLDLKAIKKEEAQYRDMPLYYDFEGKSEEVLRNNFLSIINDVQEIVNEFKNQIHTP
ncbi:type IV secretory system conjugative DNA transfer family protein [Pedobacter hiemivivus]|uniref:Type IV secretory system conjugative DNA transfer family protein n=2 Tax=Pedobacter hiemivivus TaxID=2530454 RepID=A0A4R0NEK9_9SPHI|nr:type IV secretory system conjugative DNA transfer family protein [Pedobacter hiemivivus]